MRSQQSFGKKKNSRIAFPLPPSLPPIFDTNLNGAVAVELVHIPVSGETQRVLERREGGREGGRVNFFESQRRLDLG
jgi:hypothetical protein